MNIYRLLYNIQREDEDRIRIQEDGNTALGQLANSYLSSSFSSTPPNLSFVLLGLIKVLGGVRFLCMLQTFQ